MYKKIFLLSILFLSSCISIAVDEPQAPTQSGFVTATLIPTKIGFVPATITPTVESTIAPTLAVTENANCKDSAILLRDVTIPDDTQMKAGETFTKTWEFQNSGECNWIGYTIQFDSGDQLSAPLSAPIADTLPNGKVQVSIPLTAPIVNGGYTGNFTLNNSKGNPVFIGTEKTFWVKIIVGNPSPQTPSASTIASPLGTKTPFVPSGGNSNCNYTQNANYVSQLISLINQARTIAKLPSLTINAQLTSAAQKHSVDMACNNFLDHTGSDGSTIGDRLSDAGYSSFNYYEIIAIGTPQNAIDQWRADEGHWEVVLNPSIKSIGVGYAYYADSDFGGYITVDVGSP